MATQLDQIVDVTITQETAAVPQPSFSVALILGTSNRFTSPTIYQYFTAPSDMLIVNGGPFEDTDPEYIRAVELFEQGVVGTQFAVGSASASVAQVDTITVGSVSSGDVFTETINGQTFTYTANGSDTPTTVAAAMAALINAVPALNVKAVASSGAYTVTAYNWAIQVSSPTPGANWPGEGFSDAVTGNLTLVATTANHSFVEDLQAIQALNSGFYCIIICSENWWDILTMAKYIESQTLIFIATSDDVEIADENATGDVLSQLKGLSVKRTALLYSLSAPDGPDAGWAGGIIPITPGATIWAFATIIGITPDNLSGSVQNTIIGVPGEPGKNGNIYTIVGGVPVVRNGQAAGGQYLDITTGLDWLKAQIQTNIWSLITSLAQAGSKIPYTDQGVSLLVQQVRAAIDLGGSNGLIDLKSPITVSAPAVLSVPQSQRANRIAPTISFTCRLAGAVQSVVVNGTVSV